MDHPSTGELRELLMLSRTKLNVDHAGLSQLLLPLKVPNSSKKVEDSNPSPNKNSSPAIPLAMDAMVDGKLKPCHTLPLTVKLPSLNTHTLLDTETLEDA